MKKKCLLQTLALALLICAGLSANATIWRVNNLSDYDAATHYGENFGGTTLHPVFKQLTQAAASGDVRPGDTVHLEGSTNVYDGFSLTKKLIIIGTGYYLTQNPNTSANLLASELAYIGFSPGSEGSQLIGVAITTSFGVDISASNITVRRCRILYNISFSYSITDFVIDGNFFEGSGTSSAITVTSFGAPANVTLSNNIFQKAVTPVAGTVVISFTECKNNVFDCPVINNNPSLRFNCASFQNNILKTPGVTVNINNSTNQNVSSNFSASSAGQFGSAGGNLVVDMTALFVSPTGATPDGKYKLKPGSAIGSDNTERGAFGGAAVTSRYVLSGLAPIPVIYNVTTSGVAGPAGLPVTIKARTIQ